MIDPTNANTALATAIVDELARSGARHAFISPGSRSAPLALALSRHPAVEVTIVLDERSAGFAALGASQATGVATIVLTTSGSAVANLHPAIVEADEAAAGIVLMTADRPSELRGIGAGQTIDQTKIFGGAVRWFCDVGVQPATAEGMAHVRSVACRAFARAAGDPRPGPVHLNLPWREPLAPEEREGEVEIEPGPWRDGRPGGRPYTTVRHGVAEPPEELLDELAEAVSGARQPIVVAGRRPIGSGAEDAILELASRCGLPLLAEPTSQLRVAGVEGVVAAYDLIAHARPAELAPDLVVRFGDMPTSKALRSWLSELDLIRHVVVDPLGGFNDPVLRADAVIRCDEGHLARGLAARLGGGERAPRGEAWRSAEETAQRAIDSVLDATGPEPAEPRVQRALANAYREGDLVHTASSLPVRDQEAYLPPTSGVGFLANRGANGIDGTISSAAGAVSGALRPGWLVIGDLALIHDVGGLGLLAGAASPLRIVLLDNGGGAIFDQLPVSSLLAPQEMERLFTTPHSQRPEDAARWAGVPHDRIDSLDQLAEAPERTALLEVRLDRVADHELRRATRDAVARALRS